MDWWLIPIGIGVAVLLWFLWVAAFHPDETVSAMPELDVYAPGKHEDGEPARSTADEELTAGERSVAEPATGLDPTNAAESEPAEVGDEPQRAAGTGTEARNATDDDGGTWIELDITPLFPSSERRQTVDLTEAEDPEVTP